MSGAPPTLFACDRARARKSLWQPLLPSGPGASPKPTSARLDPSLLSVLLPSVSWSHEAAPHHHMPSSLKPLTRALGLLHRHQFRQ